MPNCKMCGSTGETGYPLVQCTEDGQEYICRRHRCVWDSDYYCPEHFRTIINTERSNLQTYIQGKIDTPATLDSWEDVEAEVLCIWQKMKALLITCQAECDDMERIVKNAGVV